MTLFRRPFSSFNSSSVAVSPSPTTRLERVDNLVVLMMVPATSKMTSRTLRMKRIGHRNAARVSRRLTSQRSTDLSHRRTGRTRRMTRRGTHLHAERVDRLTRSKGATARYLAPRPPDRRRPAVLGSSSNRPLTSTRRPTWSKVEVVVGPQPQFAVPLYDARGPGRGFESFGSIALSLNAVTCDALVASAEEAGESCSRQPTSLMDFEPRCQRASRKCQCHAKTERPSPPAF